MDLTVKDLKNTFGDRFDVINNLCRGYSNDYVFTKIMDASDSIGIIYWGRDDIRDVLEYHFNIDNPTEEEIDKIVAELEDFNDDLNENDNFNDSMRDLLVEACYRAGCKEISQLPTP